MNTHNNELTNVFIKEMQHEYWATYRCLDRIPFETYKFKPHPSSMEMGYLALLVAEIPQWITYTIREGKVDFETYPRFNASSKEQMLEHFKKCFNDAIDALESARPEDLEGDFELKRGDTLLFRAPKLENIGSSINHWIHHRGQLTVYMRMQDIDVPSIYGPSGDENTFDTL